MAISNEALEQLIIDAGGVQAALDLIKQKAVQEDIILSKKALEGVFSITVNDWPRLRLFLLDRAHAKEIQGFPSLCQGVNQAIEARDVDAFILNLLLAYRVTRSE